MIKQSTLILQKCFRTCKNATFYPFNSSLCAKIVLTNHCQKRLYKTYYGLEPAHSFLKSVVSLKVNHVQLQSCNSDMYNNVYSSKAFCYFDSKRIISGSWLILSTWLIYTSGHGRLMDPPNRSSLWRFSEFVSHNPPRNYDDNQLFCGGFSRQHLENRGKCGLCGDSWNDTRPRANEHKGVYGRGIISRRYKQGKNFTANVELTFGHLGYFEFRLCNLENATQTESENCFDQYLLSLAGGSGTKFPVPDLGAHSYKVNLQLPKNLTCEHCVLQWHYVAGNSWGNCGNGTSGSGCGPQETFRGCSDITIENINSDV